MKEKNSNQDRNSQSRLPKSAYGVAPIKSRRSRSVALGGNSIVQLIEDIDQRFPGVKDRLCEADGKVRRFVNEEDIRFLENLQTPISEKGEVSMIPAIARS
jgi:sulfur-carrier protein